MENPREKAYSFSYCLFAYIYKDIHEKRNLPLSVDYTVPRTKLFKNDIAECILHVCRVHEKFLKPVFLKIFPAICISEEHFFEYVRWYYDKVACSFTQAYYDLYSKCNFEENPVGPFFIKFFTLCSFTAELVRFCFEEKCYNFTSSGPTCLAEMILKMYEFDEYFPSLTDAFINLNRFCFDVMNDAAINANSLCDLFIQQTEVLQQNTSLTLLKNSLSREVLALPSSKSRGAVEDNEVHQMRHKRKSNVLIDSYDDILKTECNPDSGEDCEVSTSKFPKNVSESCKSSETELSADKRCAHCNEVCLSYLEDFVDDFKETNYED